MTASLLLALKLTLTPVLVAAMSFAAKRFGPTFGGLIMGQPWMTGPILYFLTIEKGPAFAGGASIGILLAVVAIAAYLLAYVWCARLQLPWSVSLLAAASAFTASGVGLSELGVDAVGAAVLGAGALFATFLMMPKPRSGDGPRQLPWWDIPMRMIATALMVAVITVVSDRIGARLSGVVASFPVITTVIGCFSHARWGADAVIRLMRAMALSLLAFVAFFSTVAATAETLSPAASFAIACAAGLSVSAVLIMLTRLRTARTESPTASGHKLPRGRAPQ